MKNEIKRKKPYGICLGAVIIIIVGVCLIIKPFGGLYWLLPAILTYLIWSVNNALALVIQATDF